MHYGDDGLGEIFDMLDTVDKVDLMILVPIMKMVDEHVGQNQRNIQTEPILLNKFKLGALFHYLF